MTYIFNKLCVLCVCNRLTKRQKIDNGEDEY